MSLVISATGTITAADRSYPAVLGKHVGGSGVTFQNIGDTDFDSKVGIQRGINLFDELDQFVAILAATLGVPGVVIIDQLRLMLNDMRRQPEMGQRVYAP